MFMILHPAMSMHSHSFSDCSGDYW